MFEQQFQENGKDLRSLSSVGMIGFKRWYDWTARLLILFQDRDQAQSLKQMFAKILFPIIPICQMRWGQKSQTRPDVHLTKVLRVVNADFRKMKR